MSFTAPYDMMQGVRNYILGVLMSFGRLLSKREFQVLELISSGSTNSQIANKLGITQSTAKTHLRNIYSKTDCHNRTNLAIDYLTSKT